MKNPGFPFWLAGIEDTVGQRMPSPPLDMAVSAGGWDGGLPRHSLDGYAASGCTPVAGQTVGPGPRGLHPRRGSPAST